MAKFVIFQDRSNGYRWRLKSANGEIIATSESYVSKQGAKTSVSLIKRLAALAVVIEL